jgi:general transcription factor 3C polypeptide 3 (transcription factor C subunit 4)
MFAALMRMCHTPISWYTSGPTQKFILRQIKTVDYAISNPVRQQLIHKDKASYTHLDQNGKSIINKELDVHLLMIYGHILIAGASYLYALNYFHRALTQDPHNPMILLALGLSYTQYALKRQIENRQHTLMQGFAFLQRYYDIRNQSQHFIERQEAHYNMARAYHLVGLTNLAIPYYMKVLKGEGKRRDELGGFNEQGSGRQDEDENGVVEDMCVDTAYNLQVIYSVAGNYKLAEKVTKKWLVI